MLLKRGISNDKLQVIGFILIALHVVHLIFLSLHFLTITYSFRCYSVAFSFLIYVKTILCPVFMEWY